MADTLKLALLIEAKGGQATVGEILAIQKVVENTKKRTEELKQVTEVLTTQYGLTAQEAAKVSAELDNASKAAGGFDNFLQGVLQGAGQQAFRILSNAIAQVPAKIASSTLEFEKFDTVLTTTLGSAEQADKALEGLREFAATTPTRLDEVVESYIKLKNRGIEPTNEALTKLGDLTASQGKSLDDIVEATLDASTGQFRRLKEFGIVAKDAGDQVAFTFKGVTQVVDQTPEAISQAIFKFAELEGVAGGMEARSQTLGGQLSNLEDNGTKLAVTFGNELVPVLREFVEGANAGGDGLENLAKEAGKGTADTLRLIGNGVKLVADNGKILEVLLQVLILRLIAIRTIALYDTLVQAAQGMVLLAAQTGAATTSSELLGVILGKNILLLKATAASAAAAFLPLVALAGAVALTGLVKTTQDIKNTEVEIDALAGSTDALTAQTIRLGTELKGLNRLERENGQLTAEQTKKRDALRKLTQDQIAANQEQIKSLQSINPATEEQRQGIESQIASLQRLNQVAATQVEGNNKSADSSKKASVSTKDQTEEIKRQAEAIKDAREEEKRRSEEAQRDTAEDASQEFNDAAQQRQQSFQDSQQKSQQEFTRQQAEEQKALAEDLQQELQESERQLNAEKTEFDKARQASQQQFAQSERELERQAQDAKQAKERESQSQRQSQEQAFQDAQKQKQDAAAESRRQRDATNSGAFDDAKRLADQQSQLLQVDDAKRQALEAKFREEQRTRDRIATLDLANKTFDAAQIAALAKQVSGVGSPQTPEDAAKVAQAVEQIKAEADKQQKEADRLADIELKKQQREEERQFKAQQLQADIANKAQQQAADDARDAAKEQRKILFEEQLRAKQDQLELKQQAAKLALEESQSKLKEQLELKQQAAKVVFETQQRDLQRAFETQERDLQRAFADQQREAERAFKATQRRLDEESAQRQKTILDAAKAAVAPRPTARRSGGPVRPGEPYLVGEEGPELILPYQSGYVLTARQTAALMRPAVTNLMPSAVVMQQAADSGLLKAIRGELQSLRREMASRSETSPNNYILPSAEPYGRAIELSQMQAQAQMQRGGLG